MLCYFQVYNEVQLYIYPLFFRLFFSPYRPLENIEQVSLCYIVSSFWLFVVLFMNTFCQMVTLSFHTTQPVRLVFSISYESMIFSGYTQSASHCLRLPGRLQRWWRPGLASLRLVSALLLLLEALHVMHITCFHPTFSSVQFSSVAQQCPTLCDP